MKKFILLFQSALLLTALTSCIRDEALNAECDIVGVEQSWVNAHKEMIIGQPIVTNTYVSFSIVDGSDRSALDPSFVLSEGTRLTMMSGGAEVDANGVTRNFSSPQEYIARSQDGNWSKTYTVSFNYPQPIGLMSFEHYQLDNTNRYHEWYEVDTTDVENPKRDYWSTGNPGYAMTGKGKGKTYEVYPTISDPLGYKGNCVRLITRSTGSFGDLVKMPIAAGNIFIGTFDTQEALKKPREATHFGLQLVGGKPVSLEGYYKYKAGEKFTVGKVEHPEFRDTADIYAVVYEVDPADFQPLNGDDVLTSSRIVMMARIDYPGEPQEWTHFVEPFRLLPGKEWSDERVRMKGYAIAVVATSSRQGAYFNGAVGSTLWVDELKVNWEE